MLAFSHSVFDILWLSAFVGASRMLLLSVVLESATQMTVVVKAQASPINTTMNTSTVGSNTGDFLFMAKRYIGTEHRLLHDGLVRWFMEYPPPPSTSTSANHTVPVLILLHFGTGNMRSSRLFGRSVEKDPWLRLAAQYGYLVLSPSAVAPRRWGRRGYNTKPYKGDWNDLLGGVNNNVADINDVGFISSLVDWAVRERNGDPTRVYIYGFSNGGTMVQRMIIERPNLFAAAAAGVANLPAAYIPFPNHSTPFFLMCGTKDNRMPYLGGIAADKRGVLRSAESTRDFFVDSNQAGPNMIETMLPDTDPTDNCRIISQFFPSDTAPVQYYRMDGGGHNFAGEKSTIAGIQIPNTLIYVLDFLLGNPCHDADGVQLAWDFMTKFTLS